MGGGGGGAAHHHDDPSQERVGQQREKPARARAGVMWSRKGQPTERSVPPRKPPSRGNHERGPPADDSGRGWQVAASPTAGGGPGHERQPADCAKGAPAQPPRTPFAPWLSDALFLAAWDAARWSSKPPHRRARRRRARGCRPSCMRFRSDSFRSRALGFPVRDPRSSGVAALGRSRERRVGGFYRFVLSIVS